jgi:hypothetical protein
VRNETSNNNKHSLKSNTKGYGGKIHRSESQNSDTTAASGRELYHLQFSLQAASPETFGYTLVAHRVTPRPKTFSSSDEAVSGVAKTCFVFQSPFLVLPPGAKV